MDQRHGEQILANARIVLNDEVISGSLRLCDGRIEAIDTGGTSSGAIDCEGDYLIPGLVELHTDSLEKHYQPRSGVFWDPISAAISHDTQIAGAGITTVFDCLTLGADQGWGLKTNIVDPLIEALDVASQQDMLRAEHFLHLRCEVSHPHIIPTLDAYIDHPLFRFMSLMDHAPGDRQSPDIEAWRRFQLKLFAFDPAALDRYEKELLQNSATFGTRHRRALSDMARGKKLPLASHDDASRAHIEEACDLGAVLTEFPTTEDAARSARAHGLSILMGAPNLMRDRSISGNVTASHLAANGLLDMLSSDYIPASLLPAAFKLTRPPLEISLPQAIGMVTAAPAWAAGLHDRGRIAPGLRADLVRVRLVHGHPLVRGCWREGTPVG